MERTLNYPGNKGNIRSENIHERYLTLEQMFHSMPDDIPLLIEISTCCSADLVAPVGNVLLLTDNALEYPMLFEANDFKMDTFAPELNHFLDTILAVTYAHAGPRRQIILASFSPEICMVLAVKQQTYPILFGSDASNYPTGDQRATSTEVALRFAHRFGLAGVLMASEPFVASPGLVGLVRAQGLYLATYGPLNDDANCATVSHLNNQGKPKILTKLVYRSKQRQGSTCLLSIGSSTLGRLWMGCRVHRWVPVSQQCV